MADTFGFGFDNILSDSTGISKAVTSTLKSITPSELATRGFSPPSQKNYTVNPQSSDGSEGDERLYIIRSRASKELYTTTGVGTYTTDRGPIASIRILSTGEGTPVTERKYRLEGDSDDMSGEAEELSSQSGYSRFFLTNVQAAYSEKMQVFTTFGDNEVVYYFGKQPVQFNISGLLFDSIENDWFSAWVALYEGAMRGTRLATNYELLELVLPNMRLVGTITNFSYSQDSSRDTDIPFSFSFLAKEYTPLSAPIPEGQIQNLRGEMINWSVGRSGLDGWGAKLGIGSFGGFTEAIGGSLFGSLFAGGSAIDDFRKSVFSPIYGVITSIAKVVKSVTGSITSLTRAYTNPVISILRDINNIFGQAVAIAKMVEGAINDVVSIPDRTAGSIAQELRRLKNNAGVLARIPENISQVMKRNWRNGRIKKGAAILSSGKKRNKSKAAVLSSGAPYTPRNGYVLT